MGLPSNRDGIEWFNEGLSQYIILNPILNSYFQKVEYEVIHQNKIELFLKMQIRQKDDKSFLLYDVTGGATLKEVTDTVDLGKKECREILQFLLNIFEITESFMLDMSHVRVDKNLIFLMKDGRLRLMYDPEFIYHVEKDIIDLFAWLLSKLDYKEEGAIHLAYRAYDIFRNQGVSAASIKEALQEDYSAFPGKYQEKGLKDEDFMAGKTERDIASNILEEDDLLASKEFFPNKGGSAGGWQRLLIFLAILALVLLVLYGSSFLRNIF